MDVSKYQPYMKAIAAFIVGLGQFLVILSTAASDGIVTTDEAITVVTSLVGWLGGTLSVYQVRNKPVGK